MRRVLAAGLLATVACGGDGPGGIPVREVAVTAASSSLVVGATTQLTAVVTGADGNVMPGAAVSWSSLAPTVVSVSAAGVATALQAGQGSVRASSGGRSGDVTLTVKNPPVAALAFDRDSAVLTLPSGSVTLVPGAKDAGGHPIPNPTLFFSTDAPRVAAVTQLGVVTAVAAGTANIAASADGVTATVRVRVTAGTTATSPRITTVTPLVAGGQAVISGSNFAPTVNGNAVLVEGVAATVTAASTTQLTITLPLGGWPCSAARPVSLQVNANNESGVASVTLRTALARSLAVGQSLILSAPGESRCNELANTGGAYLVTVYNPARTIAGNDASFQLGGSASASRAQAAAIVAPATRPAVRAPSPVAPRRALPSYAPIGSPRFARWQEMIRADAADAVHADVMQRSIAFARAAGSPTAALRRLRASTEGAAPATGGLARQVTTVGAVTPLKIPNLDAPNFCASSIAVGVRTAWVGQHAVIVEDTASAIDGASTLRGQLDSLYAQVGQEFDTVMWPILTQDFGNPLAYDGHLSGTGKVVMLFSPRINTMAGGLVSGFVASCDFYPTSTAASSNVGEYFYAFMPTTTAASGSGSRLAWLRQIRGTIIHEVKHITSLGERFSRNANFEELWLEEGLARHAEEQYARGIYGIPWRGNTDYQGSVFCDLHLSTAPQCAGRPVLMLRHFDALYQYLQSPEQYSVLGRISAGDATFYATSWSIVRWMMDQYATSEPAFLSALVQSSQSGVANLEARVSGHPWEEMFGEWALSLYADDYPGVTFANAHLQWPSWNLRSEFAGLCNDLGPCAGLAANTYPLAFPLVPQALSFGAFNQSVAALNAASFSAFLLSGAQAAPQVLELKGINGGEPPPQLRLAIARVR